MVWVATLLAVSGCVPQSAEPEVDVPAKIAELAEASAAGKTGGQQLPWNFRPYQVKIWVVPDSGSRWTESILQSLHRDLVQQLQLIEPSAWQVQAEVVPGAWRQPMERWRLELDELPAGLFEQLAGWDKLVLIRLEDTGTQIEFRLNELDLNGWSLGPAYRGAVSELAPLAARLADTTGLAFRPIVRLEHSEGDIVTARVRAAGLMWRPAPTTDSPATDSPATDGGPNNVPAASGPGGGEAATGQTVASGEASSGEAGGGEAGEGVLVADRGSPCWIESGEVFEPVLREANRQRKFELQGIKAIDFTLLVQQGAVDQQYIKAKVVSVSRGDVALGRRKGRNSERIGIVVRTPPANTTIRLFTKRGTSLKDLQEVPLNGYQIYSRSIFGTEDSFEYLGKTDWNGQIQITPGEERVRLLLVKNGERNLARLPVMPGYKPFMERILPDDDERILAEGVVSGLKSEALDLWARRAVLSERIRMALQKNEYAMADRFYALYRELISVNQWNDFLSNYERRLVSSEKRQQDKISAMFTELKQFASKEFKLEDDLKVQEMMLKARQERNPGQEPSPGQ
jgi:hypothetical protein